MGMLARTAYQAAHLLGVTALMRAFQGPRVPVLMYHGVSSKRIGGVLNCEKKHVAAADLERHLRFLKSAYQVIPLSRYGAILRGGGAVPRGVAVVTFDDGYENNFSHAFPLLKKYGVPATVFVTADFIEKGEPLWVDRLASAFAATTLPAWADSSSGTLYPLGDEAEKVAAYLKIKADLKRLPPRDHAPALESLLKALGAGPDLPRLFAPLRPEQVRELAASGLVEIGSHCCRHMALTNLDPDEARREVTASRERVAALSGRPVECFSYPNGDTNPLVAGMVEAAGYSCAVAEGLGLDRAGKGSRFAVARLALKEDDDEAAVAATLCGLRSLGMSAARAARIGPLPAVPGGGR
ncbi:MAG: polysaccharide deacetylase family protein [Elusimicrobia bacterium]|nr:polysaccharide deacetylase family protein [Elusimicrobiota bacterium]